MEDELTKTRILTLREIICSQTKVIGNIEIRNECNETLIEMDRQFPVISIERVIHPDILAREVLGIFAIGDVLVFKVRGDDDID